MHGTPSNDYEDVHPSILNEYYGVDRPERVLRHDQSGAGHSDDEDAYSSGSDTSESSDLEASNGSESESESDDSDSDHSSETESSDAGSVGDTSMNGDSSDVDGM